MFQFTPLLLCVWLAAPAIQDQSVATLGLTATEMPGLVPAVTAPPAQGPQDRPPVKIEPLDMPPPTPAHTGFHALLSGLKGDIVHLPSTQNLYIAGIGGALALGMHPIDQTVNDRLINHYDTVNLIFAPGKYYGDTPEQMAFAIGTWAVGRLMDKPKMSHLGMDLLRAQAITEMLVEPIKFATGRERPDGSNHQSFPSGHAAVTFATATVIQRHLGWKRSLVPYIIASYVAASRLHDNRHYLSDVVFGAAVGTIAGRTVTEHGRDTWVLNPTRVPGGFALTVARTGF